MAYEPHADERPTQKYEKMVSLPNGTRVSEAEIRAAFREIFATDKGKLILEYLCYKARANPLYDQENVNLGTAAYNVARFEFINLIESMSV